MCYFLLDCGVERFDRFIRLSSCSFFYGEGGVHRLKANNIKTLSLMISTISNVITNEGIVSYTGVIVVPEQTKRVPCL